MTGLTKLHCIKMKLNLNCVQLLIQSIQFFKALSLLNTFVVRSNGANFINIPCFKI